MSIIILIRRESKMNRLLLTLILTFSTIIYSAEAPRPRKTFSDLSQVACESLARLNRDYNNIDNLRLSMFECATFYEQLLVPTTPFLNDFADVMKEWKAHYPYHKAFTKAVCFVYKQQVKKCTSYKRIDHEVTKLYSIAIQLRETIEQINLKNNR